MEFEKKVVELDVNDVLPNRFQPRIKFNEDSINELSESIKEHGVIQPIVVRAMGDKYEIIAGERRYKASLLAGKQTIPAIITDLNDKDSAEVALIENVQRKDLTPIEEAISYKKILDMGYLTQEELASKLGKNQGTVANKLRLLNLDDEVQEAVLEERISERHARSLLKLKDKQQQVEMLNNIINNRLTVRKTDEAIANLLNSVKEEKEVPVIIDEVEEFNPFKITEPMRERGENGMIEEFNPFKLEQPNNNVTEEPSIAPPVASTSGNIFGLPATENQNIINPGFMDINNIEENAKDIRVETPMADMNSLLTPLELPKMEAEPTFTPIAPAVEEEKPVLTSNKFFALPIEEENNAAPQKSVDELMGMRTKELASPLDNNANPNGNGAELFSFNFDNTVSTVAPVEQPVEATPAPVVPVAPAIPGMPTEPVTTPVEQPSVSNTLETLSMPSTPVVEAPTPLVQPVENPLMPTIETMPSTIATPVVSDQVPANNRIMEALTLVRNCSKQLEELGFVVDMEEIDFESLYQFIIKIQK